MTTGFTPYLMTGYPDEKTYLEIVASLVKKGITRIEAGIPCANPHLDGDTLKKVNKDMTTQGHDITSSLHLLEKVKNMYPTLEICVMTYIEPVLKYGFKNFIKHLESMNIEYVLCPDMSFEDNKKAHFGSIKNVNIVSSDMNDETIKAIAQQTTGFLYVVSYIGKTGESRSFHSGLKKFITRLRNLVDTEKELIVGFGIKTREDIEFLGTLDIDGFIIGSELMRKIEKGGISLVKDYLDILL